MSQLYAVVEAGEAAPERLSAALDAAPIASVLIAPAAGAALDAGSAQPLVEMAQKANAAALLAGDAELARTLRADGVHLNVGKDLAGAYEARARNPGQPRHRRRRRRHLAPRRHDAGRGRRRLHRLRRAAASQGSRQGPRAAR